MSKASSKSRKDHRHYHKPEVIDARFAKRRTKETKSQTNLQLVVPQPRLSSQYPLSEDAQKTGVEVKVTETEKNILDYPPVPPLPLNEIANIQTILGNLMRGAELDPETEGKIVAFVDKIQARIDYHIAYPATINEKGLSILTSQKQKIEECLKNKIQERSQKQAEDGASQFALAELVGEETEQDTKMDKTNPRAMAYHPPSADSPIHKNEIQAMMDAYEVGKARRWNLDYESEQTIFGFYQRIRERVEFLEAKGRKPEKTGTLGKTEGNAQSLLEAERTEGLAGVEKKEIAFIYTLIQKIKGIIIESNKPLVAAQARKIAKLLRRKKSRAFATREEDLISEGNILLLEKIIDCFDYRKGFRFQTYAATALYREILRQVCHKEYDIKLDPSTASKINKIRRASKQFHDEFGRWPETEEIAAALDMKVSRVHELQQSLQRFDIMSTLSESKVDPLTTLSDPTADTHAEILEELETAEYRKKCIEACMESLTNRERMIIRRAFGLDGPEESLAVIAQSMGVSREMTSKLSKRAMKKIREGAKSLAINPEDIF